MTAAAITIAAAETSNQRRPLDGEGAEEGTAAISDPCAWIADDDSFTETGRAMAEPEAGTDKGAAAAWTAESDAAATLPELAGTEIAELERPDSVSRLSRCRSVRISAAL